MPVRTYTTFRCPYCKLKLETRQGVGTRIGEPLVVCPRCTRVIVATNMCNEWDLMSPTYQKFMWFMSSLGFPLAAAGMAGFIGAEFLAETINRYVVYAASALLAVVLSRVSVTSLRNEIAESRRRISDPAYRALLERYGLYKKST